MTCAACGTPGDLTVCGHCRRAECRDCCTDCRRADHAADEGDTQRALNKENA